jgi:hypothetical protein
MEKEQYLQVKISEADSRRNSIIEERKVLSKNNLPYRLSAFNFTRSKE